MKADRVTRKEILQAIRDKGFVSVDQVAAVVLETDGSLNVLNRETDDRSSLADVT